MKRALLIFMFSFLAAMTMHAGEDSRAKILRAGLDGLAVRDTAYNQKIDISVTNFSIAELVKGIAISNGLSIDVNFDRKKMVTCNFIQQPVKDVLYFICTEKNVDAVIVGNIVTLVDYVPPRHRRLWLTSYMTGTVQGFRLTSPPVVLTRFQGVSPQRQA